MPEKNGQVAVVRRTGVKRRKSTVRSSRATSLKPRTQISVAHGFNNVITANENAVKITYTR